MLRDLKDVQAWLIRIIRRLDRVESGAILENSSITNGRLRLIGGLLRVDSGGRVQIVGTLEVNGKTTTTGVFEVQGPWELAGDGTITGNVSIAGNVTATGEWTQIGAWHLNGDGTITGDVDITGVLTLMSELRVSSVGKIIAGNLTIDPSSNGGSLKFAAGPEVFAAGTSLSLYSGAVNGGSIELTPGVAKISGGGARWFEVTPAGFKLVALQKVAKSGIPVGCIYKGADGFLYEG